MIYRKTTKETLAESILEISKSKSIDKITIKEIVENCGLTSGTFYNHFRDKYDLIAWIYLHQIEKRTRDYIENDVDWHTALLELLHMLRENNDFYKNALRNTFGQNSFFAETHVKSIELMRNAIMQKKGEALTKEEEFDVNFFMKGFGYCVEEWIVKDLPYTKEELEGYISRAIPDRLKEYLL